MWSTRPFWFGHYIFAHSLDASAPEAHAYLNWPLIASGKATARRQHHQQRRHLSTYKTMYIIIDVG